MVVPGGSLLIQVYLVRHDRLLSEHLRFLLDHTLHKAVDIGLGAHRVVPHYVLLFLLLQSLFFPVDTNLFLPLDV